MDEEKRKEAREKLKNAIFEEEKKGNLVYTEFDGSFTVANVESFIKQPTDGLLYDLNRLPEVVSTFLDDPKWVNDYAVYLVIKKLKEYYDLIQEKKEVQKK